MDPLIIELRCNENTMRGANPWVPYSPEEVAREAEKAWRAGASILHWHGRDPETGVPRHEVADYVDVVRRVRQTTDLITQPTLGYTSAAAVEDRIAHILALAQDPALRIEMGPVDFGPVNVDFWDAAAQRFVPGDAVYSNSREGIERTLRGLQSAGVPVTTVCWDVAQVRTALRFREAGLTPQRTFWELPFTGDAFPAGPGAEIHELLALVAAIPAGEPWLVMCFNGDVMALAAWAITLGGHVAIGTGDHDYARLGAPDNGELVARVAQLAETLGRDVATPAQARDIIGLPPLAAA
jgi:3-keto-5-aminohexanoate cleavage enzyme